MDDKINLLLIDDDPEDILIIKELIKEDFENEYDIRSVDNINDAMLSIQKEMPDLILLDLYLGSTFGKDSFFYFKQVYPEIPVIILTGLQDSNLAKELISSGVEDYLIKSEVTTHYITKAINYSLERYRNKNTLRNNLEYLESIIQAIPVPFYTTDLDGNVINYNDNFIDYFSITQDNQNSNLNIKDVFPLYMLDREIRHNNQIQNNGIPSSYQTRFKGKKTKTKHMIINKAPFYRNDGSLGGIINTLSDVTEVTQMRLDLEGAHSKLQHILESIDSFFILINLEEKVSLWNSAAEKLLGISAKNAIDKNINNLNIPWDKSLITRFLNRAISEKTSQSIDNVPFINNHNELRTLGVKIVPIYSKTNWINGFLVWGNDITDRLKLEEQLAQNQKLESIGQLAAGVAHEINNPVGFIKNNLQMLESYLKKMWNYSNEDEHQDNYILQDIYNIFQENYEGIDRISEIVDGIKEFSRVEKIDEFVPCDINAIITKSLVMTRNEFKYQFDIHREYGNIPSVNCIPGKISQVLINILINASQAIKAFGEKYQGKILIQTFRNADNAIIKISDNGPGIDESISNKIFDPFFTTKPPGQGTGLGLYISWDIIVNVHHGKLDIESKPGEGTTFIIKLPITDSP